jgi:hypothetical protein
MKNLVPPSAHNKPKLTAICIHNFFFSGCKLVISPDINKGTPIIEGINEVTEFEPDSNDAAIPHAISNPPYPIVRLLIDMPIGLYSSAMTTPQTEYLKLL